MNCSSLSFKALPLVEELLNEMRTALDAINAGDVDGARHVLYARCNPENPLKHLPTSLRLDDYSLLKRIASAAPDGLLSQTDVYALEVASASTRGLVHAAERDEGMRKILSAVNALADLGVCIA